jgi:hypothetical protein
MAIGMLCRDLTFAEQSVLANLAQHPGFNVLTRLMDDCCVQSAAEPIKLDPADPDYLPKLQKMTLVARAMNEFCATLRKAVNAHIEAAVLQANQDAVDAQMEAEAEQVINTVRRLQNTNKE